MSEAAETIMLDLTAQIVSAHVENNQVTAEELPGLIQSVYRSFVAITTPDVKPAETLVPAVPIKRSVFPDFIVCLEDGRKLTMLKRHLKTAYNLSPADYRTKWGLPPDYPMVAPNYAATRANLAKRMRLGHTRRINGDGLEATASGHSETTILPASRARGSIG